MKFNKLIKLIIILLMMSFITPNISFNLNPNKVVAAANLKINKKTLSLEVGKTYTLKITGTKDKIKWSTSDKSVVTVSNSGKVKALKPGTAIITATINKMKLTCKITVKKVAIKPGITPTNKPTLKPTITPTNTPTIVPTTTPTTTPTVTPTPIQETLTLKDAPFESVEIEYDGYKMILPKNWSSELKREGKIITGNFYLNKVYYSKSVIVLQIEETGRSGRPYSETKSSFQRNLKPQLKEDPTISEFMEYDFETKNGTAYKITYKMSRPLPSGQSISNTQHSLYFLFIPNYQIKLFIISDPISLYPDMSKVGDFLLKTLDLKKHN